MNFNENLNLEDLEDLNYSNNFELINLIQKFDSFDSFCKFMLIMKSIPTFEQISKLASSDENFKFFSLIQSNGYFKLINLRQKFELFKLACLNNSNNIAVLIFNNAYCDLNSEEIEKIFFILLESSNLTLIKWFCYLNLINIHDDRIKKKIGIDILENANNTQDYMVAKFISQLYYDTIYIL
jgi:hypothetical protein